MSEAEKAGFFKAVDEASKKAIWCAVASVDAHGAPRVRIVHPTWEGDVRHWALPSLLAWAGSEQRG